MNLDEERAAMRLIPFFACSISVAAAIALFFIARGCAGPCNLVDGQSVEQTITLRPGLPDPASSMPTDAARPRAPRCGPRDFTSASDSTAK